MAAYRPFTVDRSPCWSTSWLMRVFPGSGPGCDSTLNEVPIRQVAFYFWLAKQLDLFCPGLADPFISVTLRKFLIPPWFDLISNLEEKLFYENDRLRQWTNSTLLFIRSSPNLRCFISQTEQMRCRSLEELRSIKRTAARAMASGETPEHIAAVFFADLKRIDAEFCRRVK